MMIQVVECVPNKAKNVNLNVFNVRTGLNESKALICKFDCRKCNSKWKWDSVNVNVSVKNNKILCM